MTAMLELKAVQLSTTGVNSAWAAMRQEGYSEAELAGNKELLAFVAMHNGLTDFRKILPGRTLVIPRYPSKQTTIDRVVAARDFYVDAMAQVEGGLAAWRSKFSSEFASSPQLAGLHPPKPKKKVAAKSTATATNLQPHLPAPGLGALPTSKTLSDRLRLILGGDTNGVALPSNSATLSWDPPTSNTDGTPLTDLGGYRIQYGTASGQWDTEIDVGNVTTFKVSNLPPSHTYYFIVRAYDQSGNVSAPSNEASKLIP
jgi:hypothetical protein